MNETVQKYSAGGVIIHNGKVLLIISASRNSVALPKGALDNNETAEQAAVREVKEETGYDAEVVKKLGTYTYEYDLNDGNHYRKSVSYFLMRLANNLPPTQNLQPGEDFVTEWLEKAEALERLTFDDSKQAVELAFKSV